MSGWFEEYRGDTSVKNAKSLPATSVAGGEILCRHSLRPLWIFDPHVDGTRVRQGEPYRDECEGCVLADYSVDKPCSDREEVNHLKFNCDLASRLVAPDGVGLDKRRPDAQTREDGEEGGGPNSTDHDRK